MEPGTWSRPPQGDKQDTPQQIGQQLGAADALTGTLLDSRSRRTAPTAPPGRDGRLPAPVEMHRAYIAPTANCEAQSDPFLSGLERHGLSEADLEAEVIADLRAERVKQVKVYDEIKVPEKEVEQALRSQAGEARSSVKGKKVKPPDRLARETIRGELARARSGTELANYLESLRAIWPVAIFRESP